jgi:hypothetical protein
VCGLISSLCSVLSDHLHPVAGVVSIGVAQAVPSLIAWGLPFAMIFFQKYMLLRNITC